MAKTPQQIVEAELGGMHMQLIMQTSRVEQLTEENAKLKEENAKLSGNRTDGNNDKPS